MSLNTAQTGAQGELLVQRQLLLQGIDSARLTTDYGVDLVAYHPKSQRVFTIQVKTRSPQMGGKRPSWRIKLRKEKQANLFAFVNVDKSGQENEQWYMTPRDIKNAGLLINRPNYSVISFYREGVRPRKGSRTYQSERYMSKFRGPKGLERFLNTLRSTPTTAN